MLTRRRTCSHLLTFLLAAAVSACVPRHAPPAPVVAGDPAAARPSGYERPAPAPVASPAAGVPQAAAPLAPHPGEVVVQRGETLYAISRRYGVPVRSIIEANGLGPPYRMAAGRHLILPQVREHIVQPGETLDSIARGNGVEASTLARSNGLAAPYAIHTGQALALPAPVQLAGAPVVSHAEPPPPVVSPAPVIAPAPSVVPPPPPPVAALAPEPAKPLPAIAPAAAPPPAPPPQLAALPPPALEPAPHGNGRFLWPVRGRVIGNFGPGEGGTQNDGLNIAAPAGTPVVAADSGTVAYVGNELRGYGNLVLIKHAGGWMTAYAHNASVLVKRGEKVRRGQTIARIGSTGAVHEPQLHFEIRHGTRALDPSDYLSGSATVPVNG